jgi:dipeptidyl aminopeptidase/acylaminoacyl peptidase
LPRTLSVEDFSLLTHVGDPQVSPGGRYVAVSTIRPRLKENKYLKEIWIYKTSDAKPLAVLQSESDSSPRWSNDEEKIAFVSRRGLGEKDKGEAIYVYHLGGGEPRLLYRAEHSILQLEWMPGDREIMAIARTSIRQVDEDGDYVDIRGLPVWFDGVGFIDEYRNHILIIDYYSGNARQLSRGDYNVLYAKPSPKGDKIAALVSRDKLHPNITELVLYDVENGEEEVLLSGKYSFASLAWSPDGSSLLLQGNTLPRGLASHDHIWVFGLQERRLECITCSYDRNTRPAISSDTAWPRGSFDPLWTKNRGVLFAMADRCRVAIYSFEPGTGIEKVIDPGEGTIYGFSASLDGATIAYSKTSPQEPGDIWLLKGAEEKRLTWFNDWVKKEIKLAIPTKLTIRTSDGATIEGYYMAPLDGDEAQKKPVVMTIHGGPKACYSTAFSFFHQLLVSKGYYVIYSNPRGSDGYSEEFADIRCKYGERDYQDLMEFLDAFLEKRADADPERIAVQGISYGGFMVNWIVTHTDKFRAAISENGISDWHSDFWGSDIGYWFDPDQICGDPWRSRENYDRASPIRLVANVKTPLLLIHSMEDYRCFIDQSLAMHVALQYLGKESRLIVFTKGSHGHSVRGKPRHRLKRYKIILDFLEEKLKKREKSPKKQ